jgi:hypothetical protein
MNILESDMPEMKGNASMKFPTLSGWANTARGLHRAAQILGAIRMLTREPVENYLELALRVVPHGLSSEVLPSGGRVELDFRRAALLVIAPSGQGVALSISGRTQVALLEAVLTTLNAQGQSLVEVGSQGFTANFLKALEAKGHTLNGSLILTDPERLEVDRKFSADYVRVLWQAFTATARWGARLTGFVTPAVVWPEHFDLSTLWFATERHDGNAPHMNFGFAPFDAEFSEPYLYAYAYPMPDGFEDLPLPDGARWHTRGWKGMLIPYDVLEASHDPEGLIESAFEAVYHRLAPTLRT